MIKCRLIIAAICIALITSACQPMTKSQRAIPQTTISRAAKREATKPQVKKKPLAQGIANIYIGPQCLTDKEVVKMYGQGLFTKQEGHLGGRYFTDSGHRVTLHIEIGVDYVIDHVELSKGVSLPEGLKPSDPAFVSATLPSNPKIDLGLRLDMSSDEIIEKLGPPTNDQKSGSHRTLTYTASSDEDPRVGLCYEAEYKLVNDRLVSISLYDGE